MNEKQAMAFLTKQTKRYAHIIARRDNIFVKFEKTLGRHGGECGRNTVYYSRKMLLANLDNPQGLTDLAIHEVIHFKINGHGNDFQKEFEKYSGHPMTMYVQTLTHTNMIVPKKRGAGKTLEGKWKVEYARLKTVRCDGNPVHDGVSYDIIKERPMTKTQATKIYKMACSKDYPARLLQYVSSAVAHGWKQVSNHASSKLRIMYWENG